MNRMPSIGDIINLNGYLYSGDGAHHLRKVEEVDDGSGIQLSNGLWANLIHDGFIKPSWFGVVVGGTINQAPLIQKCINYASKVGASIIFTDKKEGAYYLASEIKFPETVKDVVFTRRNTFRVACNGTYNGEYAIQFGENTNNAWTGRGMVSIRGQLFVNSTGRDSLCNGVYIKGGWITSEYIRTADFNGTGVFLDSVWDSTFTKISVERCGNANSYAFRASSQGDTFNCTHIVSLQVEHSYNRALQLMLLRAVVSNIHCERLHTDEGFTSVTHHLDLTNSIINQGLFSASTGTGMLNMDLVLVSASANAFQLVSDTGGVNKLRVGRGWNGTISNFVGGDLQCIAPLKNIAVRESSFDTIRVETGNFYRCSVKNFYPTDNAFNIYFEGGDIDVLDFEGVRSRGQMVYSNSFITTINRCCDRPKTFSNCFIENLKNHWNSCATFDNCEIKNTNFAGRFLYTFLNSRIENWTKAEDVDNTYITINTQVTNYNRAWSYPTDYNYPRGTKTERFGEGNDIIYVNTDGALNWQPIASIPISK